jgi:hypothetical protein
MWADADADLHGDGHSDAWLRLRFFLVGSGGNVLRWIYETSLDFTVRLMMAYKKMTRLSTHDSLSARAQSADARRVFCCGQTMAL